MCVHGSCELQKNTAGTLPLCLVAGCGTRLAALYSSCRCNRFPRNDGTDDRMTRNKTADLHALENCRHDEAMYLAERGREAVG